MHVRFSFGNVSKPTTVSFCLFQFPQTGLSLLISPTLLHVNLNLLQAVHRCETDVLPQIKSSVTLQCPDPERTEVRVWNHLMDRVWIRNSLGAFPDCLWQVWVSRCEALEFKSFPHKPVLSHSQGSDINHTSHSVWNEQSWESTVCYESDWKHINRSIKH